MLPPPPPCLGVSGCPPPPSTTPPPRACAPVRTRAFAVCDSDLQREDNELASGRKKAAINSHVRHVGDVSTSCQRPCARIAHLPVVVGLVEGGPRAALVCLNKEIRYSGAEDWLACMQQGRGQRTLACSWCDTW